MRTPSRLLTSKLLRRSPPPLLSSITPNTFSHSLLPSSIHHHHHRYHDYNHRCSSIGYSVSSHYCLFFCSRYSTHFDISESEESFLPVRVLISLFDSYHDLTGFPWWIIISSSTVAMRLALLPIIILQLQKLKRIGELLPKFGMMYWTLRRLRNCLRLEGLCMLLCLSSQARLVCREVMD